MLMLHRKKKNKHIGKLICIYIHIHIHTYIYIHTYVYIRIHAHIHMHRYIHIHTHTHIYMMRDEHMHIGRKFSQQIENSLSVLLCLRALGRKILQRCKDRSWVTKEGFMYED